jgi:hypothetical protein
MREVDDLNKALAKNKHDFKVHSPYDEDFQKLKEMEAKFRID